MTTLRPNSKLWLKPTLGFFQFAKQSFSHPSYFGLSFLSLTMKKVKTGINTYLPVFWEAN